MEERSEAPGSASRCWNCGAAAGPSDNYCRACGRALSAGVPWYYGHWGLVFLTLFGLGPFSLFLVWRSPALSRNARWGYTAVIAVLTFYVLQRLLQFWRDFQAAVTGMPL